MSTGVLAVGSLITSIALYSHHGELQSRFDEETGKKVFDPAQADALWTDIQTNETLFNAFLWSGVGLGVTSVAMFMLGMVESETTPSTLSFAPLCQPGQVGMSIEMSW